MAFTDIFIKRPVLSLVVSLLILLIGFQAATHLGIRQYPKLSNTVVTITTSYPGASPDLMQGVHHAADRAGGRIGRRRRLHYVVVGAGHQHDLGLHQAQRRSEFGADRSQLEGKFGQVSHPEGVERSRHHKVDGTDHGRDVSWLRQRRTERAANIRLSRTRGAADPVDGRWRCVCRYSRRADARHPHLARSGPVWPAAMCRRTMCRRQSGPTTSRRLPANPKGISSSPT